MKLAEKGIKPTIFTYIISIAIMIMITASNLYAVQKPVPLAGDSRIRTLNYNPNDVYYLLGHYGLQSIIEFGPEEEIGTVTVGDSLAWQIVPSGNRLFMKPIEQDATTNMTVITSEHTYLFELHAREPEGINDKDISFIVKFYYPGMTSMGSLDNIDDWEPPDFNNLENPEQYNFNYSISGPERISPIRIFDDGEFTFFEFRDKNAEVPAFFLVDSDGREAIINYRVRDNYIIVERVTSQFTLRHGSDVVCVFNETMPLQLNKEDDDGFSVRRSVSSNSRN